MSESPQKIPVQRGDTLTEIASRHGFTVDAIIAANPQIRDPNVLRIGQQISLPLRRFEQTVRFINLYDLPPIGIRYELLVGKNIVANGRVGLFENEASFEADDGTKVIVTAQRIGEHKLNPVATFVAKRAHPVILVRINSFKFPSLTDLHPKTPTSGKSDKPSNAPPTQERSSTRSPRTDQGVPNQATKDSRGVPEHHVLPGECACARLLTVDELVAIFPTRKKSDIKPYLDPINEMMKTYGIDSCLRKAHVLAQIGAESGSLQFRSEILKKGVTEEKAYKGYKGRGLIQVTGRRIMRNTEILKI